MRISEGIKERKEGRSTPFIFLLSFSFEGNVERRRERRRAVAAVFLAARSIG